MKPQSIQKFFVFIITIMMVSMIPASAHAQKKCNKGNCPKGSTCVGGYCIPVAGGCNCSVRPIPFKCGQICGFFSDLKHADDMLSISDVDPAGFSLELTETQNVSLKIYDLTGRLIKILAESRMPPGGHQIEWNKTDEAGNKISVGVYFLQFDAGPYCLTKKISVTI